MHFFLFFEKNLWSEFDYFRYWVYLASKMAFFSQKFELIANNAYSN